jgi:hypothetical protein
LAKTVKEGWWWGKDSNLGRRSQQIYSLPPLTAWVPHHVVFSVVSD